MNEEIENLKYEEAVQQLEAILAKLEGRDIALEETLALFEKGMSLGRHCQKILTQTEQKIQGLVDTTEVVSES